MSQKTGQYTFSYTSVHSGNRYSRKKASPTEHTQMSSITYNIIAAIKIGEDDILKLFISK